MGNVIICKDEKSSDSEIEKDDDDLFSEEPEIAPLKPPNFPNFPDYLSDSEYELSYNSEQLRPPEFLSPSMSPMSSDGSGNIYDIFNFFHQQDMLGSAFQNNLTDTMRMQNINASIEFDHSETISPSSIPLHEQLRSPSFRKTDMGTIDEHAPENPWDVMPFNSYDNDDGDDVSESSDIDRPITRPNIIDLMKSQGIPSGTTPESIEELAVLISKQDSLRSSTTRNSISNRFSLTEELMSPIATPRRGIQRRETNFLITEGLKNDMPLTKETLEELKEDPNMWLLSDTVTANIKSTGDIARVLRNVENTIRLIEGYIPNLKELIKDETKATEYMTNVIQELLKRAHNEGLLKGCQQNWAKWQGADLAEVAQRDVQKMVKAMAWTRNNIRAANVTDANDAKMASSGATEVKGTLKRAMSRTLSTRHINFQSIRDLSDKPSRDDDEIEPIHSDPLFNTIDDSDIHE